MLIGKIKNIELKEFLVDDRLFENIFSDYAHKIIRAGDDYIAPESQRPQWLTSMLFSAEKLYLKVRVVRGFANNIIFDCDLDRGGIRKFIPFVKREIDVYQPNSNLGRGHSKGIINLKECDPKHESKEEFEYLFYSKEFGIGSSSELKEGLELILEKPKVVRIRRWPKRILLEFNLSDGSNIFRFVLELSERNFKRLFGKDAFVWDADAIVKKIDKIKMKVVMDFNVR